MLRWANRFRRSNSNEPPNRVEASVRGTLHSFALTGINGLPLVPYPPYPSTAALCWLVEAGVKLVGIDTPGLDIPGDRSLPNHHLLFAHGIPLIESLDRLGDLRQPRVYLFAQPLPAAETDAIPLRVLAFEG